MEHEMSLRHEPFEKIKAGIKTIEMRLYDEKRAAVSPGDSILFRDLTTGETILCAVQELCHYASFEELYSHHEKTALGYSAGEPADPKDMLAYYSEEKIKKYGVVAIRVRVL